MRSGTKYKKTDKCRVYIIYKERPKELYLSRLSFVFYTYLCMPKQHVKCIYFSHDEKRFLC